MQVSIVEFDARGRDYIRSELEATNQLGRLVLSAVELDKGKVMGVIPEPHAPDIYAFKAGIFLSAGREQWPVAGGHIEEVPSTEVEVASWVHTVLNSGSRRVFVCESYLLRASEISRAKNLPRQTVAGGNFVYHWSATGDRPEDVAGVVRMAYPVPVGFSVICSLPTEAAEILEDQISSAGLALLASHVDCIIVGAYDGESVLVWGRDEEFRPQPS
jgi:hypothetical protein